MPAGKYSTSVTLTPNEKKFIKSQVKKGNFPSASAAVRAGIQALQEQTKTK